MGQKVMYGVLNYIKSFCVFHQNSKGKIIKKIQQLFEHVHICML